MKNPKNLAPIDTDVEMPAAIRAAALKSEQLHRQFYPGEVEEEKAKGEENPSPEAEETSEDKPEAEVEEAKPEQEPGVEPKAQEPEKVEGKQEPKSDGDWEHRYKSLRGRYERQEQTIKGLNSRIGQLEALLAQTTENKPKEPSQTPDNKFQISEEERETYGEDFLDVAARAAASRLDPIIGELKSRLDEIQGTVKSVAQQTEEEKRQSMYSLLDGEVPNWRDVNRDPNFVAWCNLPDPFSGVIRMEMLREAYTQLDGRRVLNFFKGFLKDEAVTDPARIVKPEMPNTGKVPLENFAAPGRAKAPAAAVRPGEKETISTAQIAQFYADVNRGKYRGNEAEKERLEAMIFQAQAEGRVVN